MRVSSEEVKRLLAHLDESFLLESEKFKKAKAGVIELADGNKTAFLGDKTLVDTTVDMELAESWNPLVKSKTSAMPMMMMMSSHVASIMQSSH